jgi:hypothetical protein
MEAKVVRYVNQDLAYKSEEQKEKEFNVKIPTLNDFIGELEFSLMFLNFKHTPMFFEESGEHQFHLKAFDGAILKTNHLLDKKADMQFLNPFENNITEFNSGLIDNLNFKFFDLSAGEEKKQRLFQIRKIQKEMLRGNAKLQGQKVFEFRESHLNNNEKWYSYGKYYKAFHRNLKDAKIEMLYPTTLKPGYFINDSEAKNFIKTSDYYKDLISYYMSISGALSAYYEWFVYIRENENSIGIKVPIKPESTKEIFALRNIEEGKRKKAICHYVREHLRLLPEKNYDEEYRQVLVKEHLRGQSKFNWRGLEVHVIPAQYDLNRIKTSKKFTNV